MEISLRSCLGGERLDWLQVEVEVEMQVVEVLAMDQQVQHVVTLTTHLQIIKTTAATTREHNSARIGNEGMEGVLGTCKPTSTQSISVCWKNLVALNERNKYRFFWALGGRCLSAFNTKYLSNFWYDTRTLTGMPAGQCSWYLTHKKTM